MLSSPRLLANSSQQVGAPRRWQRPMSSCGTLRSRRTTASRGDHRFVAAVRTDIHWPLGNCFPSPAIIIPSRVIWSAAHEDTAFMTYHCGVTYHVASQPLQHQCAQDLRQPASLPVSLAAPQRLPAAPHSHRATGAEAAWQFRALTSPRRRQSQSRPNRLRETTARSPSKFGSDLRGQRIPVDSFRRGGEVSSATVPVIGR
jgi:hypothetical protein